MISGAGTEYLGKPLPEGWQAKMEAITENNIRIIGGPIGEDGNVRKEIWVLIQGYSIMQQEDGTHDHIKKAFVIMSEFFPDHCWPKTRFRYNTWYPAGFVLEELEDAPAAIPEQEQGPSSMMFIPRIMQGNLLNDS